MDEQLDLEAIGARLYTYWNDPDDHANLMAREQLIRDVSGLVAEVRRLRAGLDLMLWHATGQPAGMFDPHWYAAQAATLLGIEPQD